MHEITLPGPRGDFAALRSGNPGGPKVLALHGWLDNAASFVPLLPYFADYDIVSLDFPGHGGSAHRPAGCDYAFVDWIHDVLDVLDALEWPSAHLLGHSMGGAIACLVAAGAPARVNKLAVIEALGPLAGTAEEAVSRLQQAIKARRALNFSKQPRVMATVDIAVQARLAVSAMSPLAARLIVQRNLQPADGGVCWRSDPRLTLPGHLRTDEQIIQKWLAAIQAPTLVIAADPSPPYFTAEVRDQRLRALANGCCKVIAGGHHLHMEQPEQVAAVVLDFLN